MEQIFYTRGKGRVTKALTVWDNGSHYRLHFLALDRTNPSKAERAAGAKEKRFVTLDTNIDVPRGVLIVPSNYPLPELVKQFIDFLNEDNASGTNSD